MSDTTGAARVRSPKSTRPRRKSKNPPRARVVAPRPSRRRRRGLWLLLSVLGVAVCLVAGVLVWATRPAAGSARRVVVQLDGSETPSALGSVLAERGLVSSPRLFALYLAWFSPDVALARGPHLLRGDLSPRALVQRLLRLPSRPAVRVILPEGYTFLQIAERLEQNEVCPAIEFKRSAEDPHLLGELGIRATNAEGYLFPATYELFVDADPGKAVRQMVAETRKRLERLDAHAGGALARLTQARGWSEHEVLTLASLVEREARARDEQALVASVFLNRLDDPQFRPARMLQSDASAAYGCAVAPGSAPSCQGYQGRVTPEMLRDAQNPYNTYRHAGLPRGPIGNPGEGAIAAVLAPASTEYLYFVADGRGRHRFSRTFEEHRRAITTP